MALGVKQHILQFQISVDDAQLAGARGVLRLPPCTPPHRQQLCPQNQALLRIRGTLEKGVTSAGGGLGWNWAIQLEGLFQMEKQPMRTL